MQFGLDPVVPAAVCLVLAHISVDASKWIGSRDVPRYIDSAGAPYQCPCNISYTGNECCGTRDGMVQLS